MEKLDLSECGFTAWHEQNEALWIAAVAKYGDPVELSDFEVEKIVAFLQKFLKINFPNDESANNVLLIDKIELLGSNLYAWIEQESSVHIKAATKSGDAIALTYDDVKQIAHFLWRYLDKYAP
ncbi:MAG: hypothetical protein LBO72_09235 [Helicobacteraceae bacterium]|jgi:hypothetical protein|nr:hypothetical protein [Helicobacteraceae bacterium]